jgi:hypothetical protein
MSPAALDSWKAAFARVNACDDNATGFNDHGELLSVRARTGQ